VNDDIQFGEVETARPQKQLRPDQNKHFAVVAYGTPREGELPIFLDLDVMADMELHAESDTSVELGGVLLGAHCEDDDGKPFVLITDSLRAEHYHSTKGSFTFTHDTWAAITRRRDEFPAELAMAGWYHTHPDWGVFLSGMDMFICDNFFNKRLDVAYVIDPCRGDRAFFQWTGDARHRKKRVGGFYVAASRFRQQELELYVQQLEGKGIAMPATTSGYPGPIIHVPQPPPQPAWQPLAVIGMLALQFCFLALIAWKMIGPPMGGGETSDTAALVQKLDAYLQTRDAEVREEAQQRVYDRILRELKGTPEGTAARIAEDEAVQELVRTELPRYLARERELEAMVEDSQKNIDKLTASLEDAKGSAKHWRDKHEKLAVTSKEQQKRLDALEKKPDEKGEAATSGGFLGIGTVWWVIGGSIVILGAVAWGLTYVAGKKSDSSLSDDELVPPPPPRAKNEPEAAN
jgi:proteasome lid subunit RPN8/RPN11